MINPAFPCAIDGCTVPAIWRLAFGGHAYRYELACADHVTAVMGDWDVAILTRELVPAHAPA